MKQDEIIAKYPLLYADKNKSPRETLICFGFDCGEGWFDTLDVTSAKLEEEIKKYIAQTGDNENYPRASQVKEKFGGLRFYMSSYTEAIDKIIQEAEDTCAKTCDGCSAPGELHTSGFWLRTICENCADKENNKDDRLSKYIKYSEWEKMRKFSEQKGEKK